MKNIILHNWHLHALKGFLTFIILAFLFTNYSDFRVVDTILASTSIAFIFAITWEIAQEQLFNAAQKEQDMILDVAADMTGVLLAIILYLLI